MASNKGSGGRRKGGKRPSAPSMPMPGMPRHPGGMPRRGPRSK